MSWREFLNLLEDKGDLIRVKEEVDPYLEITQRLMKEDKVMLFEAIKGKEKYQVLGNLLSSREKIAQALGIKKEELLEKIFQAISKPSKPEILEQGSCQEVIEKEVNLNELPILTHSSKEMGPYITAGVFIAHDKDFGFNMSFHRATPIAKDKLVIRLLERDLWKYWKRSNGELEVAICLGLHPSLSLAAGISLETEVDELKIANSLKKLKLVKCQSLEKVFVPAEAEIVLEGTLTKEQHQEGPFVDITGTLDFQRKQPVVKINLITHQKNPIYQALLPSLQEHKILMGMPKEPVLYHEINKICQCQDVLLTPGGCKWLHGIIKIKKKEEGDGRKALERAFKTHKSLKHAIVMDEDINIHNPEEVEWAIATRFQGDKDMITKKEKGSSLDPSSGKDSSTVKIGIDATLSLKKDKQEFRKIYLGK